MSELTKCTACGTTVSVGAETCPKCGEPKPGIPDSDWQKYCFVASAVYGSAEAPEVATLRGWRDEWLARRRLGRPVIKLYYRLGPRIATLVDRFPKLRRTTRRLLDVLVSHVQNHE